MTKIGEERVFDARRRRPTCRSATCASCSSPKASIATGWDGLLRRAARRQESPISSRCCWRARSGRTCRRPAPSASGSCPKLALPRIVAAGNVAGEGAKIQILLSAHRERAAAAGAGPTRSSTSSCPTRPTSTISSSTSSPSRHDRRSRRLRSARTARACDRAPARPSSRRARHCRRSCTTGPSRSRPPWPRSSPICAAATTVVAVASVDCGSYGAVDALLQGTGIERLAGDQRAMTSSRFDGGAGGA